MAIADLLVLGVTWRATYHSLRHPLSIATLSQLIFRDGEYTLP